MYQDKLLQIKKQLQQLQEGVLPEYMKKNSRIEQQYRDRLLSNEIWRGYEVMYRLLSIFENENTVGCWVTTKDIFL